MSKPVRWGVLGAARIALTKVAPAMMKAANCEVVAIASRDQAKAGQAAKSLGVSRAYGSYEALLAAPDIDAVYNPLPNHLHVPWSIRAAEAGKHVLCEKPIGLSTAEVKQLIAARDRAGVKIGEAFMARTHPQWLRARDLVREGAVGDLRLVSGHFSYSNRDPQNVRNVEAWGGGGLMDIGCYPVTLSRMIFGSEPLRVNALLERDPEFRTDRLTSALLDYGSGQAVFSCSTQLAAYQRMNVFGTRGRIEIEIPFNAPPDRPTRLWLDDGSSLFGAGIRTEEFPVCDQYTIQGELFSAAIQNNTPVPVPLEDAIQNMAVIDALFRSAKTGNWETPSI